MGTFILCIDMNCTSIKYQTTYGNPEQIRFFKTHPTPPTPSPVKSSMLLQTLINFYIDLYLYKEKRYFINSTYSITSSNMRLKTKNPEQFKSVISICVQHFSSSAAPHYHILAKTLVCRYCTQLPDGLVNDIVLQKIWFIGKNLNQFWF